MSVHHISRKLTPDSGCLLLIVNRLQLSIAPCESVHCENLIAAALVLSYRSALSISDVTADATDAYRQ